MITAEMVHNISLKRSFRGYNVMEVDNFLEEVESRLRQDAQNVEEMRGNLQKVKEEKGKLLAEIEALKGERQTAENTWRMEITKLQDEIKKFDEEKVKLDDSMKNVYQVREIVIRDASVRADEIVEQANLHHSKMETEAQETLQKAKDQAQETLQKAQDQAEETLRKAQERADKIVSDALERRDGLNKECDLLYYKVADFRAKALEFYHGQMEALKSLLEYVPLNEIPMELTVVEDMDGEEEGRE